ncbi:MAG: DUF1295 domain-containing protein [Pseudomonadota bacterium]
MTEALVATLVITALAFTGIWLINVMTRNAGVIDYYWGPGFAVIAIVHLLMRGNGTVFEWILTGAITFWALRLAQHLVRRHHASHAEDGRYAAMRESGGASYWWASLFQVFLLQAALLWLIAAPVHVAFGNALPVNEALFGFGIAMFVVGLFIEWVADYQLATGKEDIPEDDRGGTLFTSGLWGISRHPNYVGEMILWWGLAIAAFAMSGNPIALAGPMLLCAVMIGVSIPLTEQHLAKTRASYADYQNRVPMLFSFGGAAPRGREIEETRG